MTGPPRAVLGENVQYRITLTNHSNQPLSGVALQDAFDDGFHHAQATSPMKRRIGELAPGQTFDLAVTFQIVKTGTLRHVLRATADGGHLATSEAELVVEQPPTTSEAPPAYCGSPGEIPRRLPVPSTNVAVETSPQSDQPATSPLQVPVAPPMPNVAVRVTGPTTANVGQVVKFQVSVTNRGQTPLTNVWLFDQWSPSLVPTVGTSGYRQARGGLWWYARSVPPGYEVKVDLHARCDRTDPQACNRITVTSDQSPAKSQEACVRVVATSLESADEELHQEDETPDMTVDPEGVLKLNVSSLTNPARVGTEAAYLVVVTNDSAAFDRNVTVTVRLPAGLRFQRVSDGPVGGQSVSSDGRTVSFRPIIEMRPREAVSFRLHLKTIAAGTMKVSAEATSLHHTSPIEAAGTTTVF